MTAELEKALNVIADALECYAEDCIGSDEYEDEQKSLDKSWQLVLNTLKQTKEYKQDSYAPATKQAVEQTDENIGQANLPTFEDMQKEMKKYPHRDNHMD